MSDTLCLLVGIQAHGSDAEGPEVAELTQRLRWQLLDLDVLAVEKLPAEAARAAANGADAVVGWLTVALGSVHAARTVLSLLTDWTRRTDRSVEIRLRSDRLSISNATEAQQDHLIDEFLARHDARA